MPTGRALLYCAGGGIGDSLVASVVARALHAQYATVDALTLAGHTATLERVPDIDAVYVDQGDEHEVARSVASRCYDACVVTWATARTAGIAKRSGISVRVGQGRRLYSAQFTHRVVVRSERGDVISHWSQVLLDYARAIGCDTGDPQPRFVPTEADEREAALLLSDVLGEAGRRFVILHATTAISTKRPLWPTGSLTALAAALRERYGPVLLSGVASEAAIHAPIVAGSGAISLAGRASIGAFGAIARRARAFAGIHSGTMHVAAAVGAPTVAIFPLQVDFPDRWRPLGARVAVVRSSYPCRPGELMETCPDYACIEHLPVARVLAALEGLAG